MAKSKKGSAGRPSKYSKIFAPRLAEMLARAGMTDKEMAIYIGIAESTFHKWKIDHPEFMEAITKGKEEPDDKVEAAMFRTAIGYFEDEATQHSKIVDGEKVITGQTITHRYFPGNVAAQIFWSKNRRPDRWKDRQEIGVDMQNDPVFILADALKQRASKEPPPQ